jgi:hypothetical protein
MVKGREEKEFVRKITEKTKWIKGEGEEKDDMRGVKVGYNRFIANFLTCCFVV